MESRRSRRRWVPIGAGLLVLLSAGIPAHGALGHAREAEAAADASEPSDPAGDEAAEPVRLRRALGFPPTGIRVDHTLRRGDWTFSYHYQREELDGLLVSTTSYTPGEVLGLGYDSTPTSGLFQMHTVGVMYAPRDRLTFLFEIPWIEKEMDVLGATSEKLESRGLGDARLTFLVPFITKGSERTHLNLGLSVPTGSIQEKDADGDRLPYAMQIGSGSWDMLWGITYSGESEFISWGGQFEGLYRLADNDIGYRLGTTYQASAWIVGGWGEWLSTSVRMWWRRTGNVRGEDPTLSKTESPLNDNKLQGGTRIDVGPGVNVLLPFLGGQRLGFEVTWPVYQALDGPQIAADMTVTAAWEWVF